MNRALVLFVTVVFAGLGVVVATHETRADHVKQVLATGAHEVRPDSVRVWWDRAAACLHEHRPLPPIRVFVGGGEPRAWRTTWDRTPPSIGRTLRGDTALLWLSAATYALGAHEAWHAAVSDAHPAAVFGTLTTRPRCGLANAFPEQP